MHLFLISTIPMVCTYRAFCFFEINTFETNVFIFEKKCRTIFNMRNFKLTWQQFLAVVA